MEDKKRYTTEEVRNKYPGCKVLMINLDISDMNNITGEIAYVSENKDTFDNIFEEQKKYESETCLTMVVGSYKDGGALGVLYRVK